MLRVGRVAGQGRNVGCRVHSPAEVCHLVGKSAAGGWIDGVAQGRTLDQKRDGDSAEGDGGVGA